MFFYSPDLVGVHPERHLSGTCGDFQISVAVDRHRDGAERHFKEHLPLSAKSKQASRLICPEPVLACHLRCA